MGACATDKRAASGPGASKSAEATTAATKEKPDEGAEPRPKLFTGKTGVGKSTLLRKLKVQPVPAAGASTVPSPQQADAAAEVRDLKDTVAKLQEQIAQLTS